MACGRIPAQQCSYSKPDDVDDGTSCRAESPLAGPLGAPSTSSASGIRFQSDEPTRLVSPTFKNTFQVPFSLAPQMTWDGFQRLAYDKLNAGLQEQATLLLKRGNLTDEEVNKLVQARNASVLQIRDRLSSFGELYSELLKPRSALKTTEQLLTEKGSLEAVLETAGKTRQVVDRIGIAFRWAGPVSIILEISIITVAIAQAPRDRRNRVAARKSVVRS